MCRQGTRDSLWHNAADAADAMGRAPEALRCGPQALYVSLELPATNIDLPHESGALRDAYVKVYSS